MIEILRKEDCCGCEACKQICPHQCIALREDPEGFLYPKVDKSMCINCHLCEKVCPVLHPNEPRKPLKVYAVKNKNEDIRLSSSSGGAFTLIAEQIIADGGVVFGAQFDKNWDVVHSYTETSEGLACFRGSKYVQSRIKDCFRQTERFLQQGRKVLFSGTPCQIAGLKHYLRKEYADLLTVDFVCHGVPSPKVWRRYLQEITKEGMLVESISFRAKTFGWKKFSFVLRYSTLSKNGNKKINSVHSSKYTNPYLKAFLRNVDLRPSCHACPFKNFQSQSDYSIADFWTINKFIPEENDRKGHSLLYAHADTSCITYNINADCIEMDVIAMCQSNSTVSRSAIPHKNRDIFFEQMPQEDFAITKLIEKHATVSLRRRIKLWIASILRN